MASVNRSFSTGHPEFPRENLEGYGPVAGPSIPRHFETGLGEQLSRLKPPGGRTSSAARRGGCGRVARPTMPSRQKTSGFGVACPDGFEEGRWRAARRPRPSQSLRPCHPPVISSSDMHEMWRGGPDIALDVWVTKEQEGLKGERVLCNLLLLHNPDAQSSVWATPPYALADASGCWFRGRTRSRARALTRTFPVNIAVPPISECTPVDEEPQWLATGAGKS